MQNRTMRAVVSTRQPAASLDFCMTWRTFVEIDRDPAWSLESARAADAGTPATVSGLRHERDPALGPDSGCVSADGRRSGNDPVHDRVESDPGFERGARSQPVVQVGRRVQIGETGHGTGTALEPWIAFNPIV